MPTLSSSNTGTSPWIQTPTRNYHLNKLHACLGAPLSPLPPHRRASRDAKSMVGIAKIVGIVSWNNRRAIGRRRHFGPRADISYPGYRLLASQREPSRASAKSRGGERSGGEKKGVVGARAVCIAGHYFHSVSFEPTHSPLAFNTTHGCNRFLSRVVPQPSKLSQPTTRVLSLSLFVSVSFYHRAAVLLVDFLLSS